MKPHNQTQHLKTLAIFRAFPEEKLEQLANVLKPVSFKKDSVIFEEGSRANSLFLIKSGQVEINKKRDTGGKSFKQLALFTEGDFFGEMALVKDQVRFARAVAQTDVTLFELEKSTLFEWIEKQPVTGISFFVEMVRVISLRLRRTSSELTMLFNLSQLVLEPHQSEKSFVVSALKEIMLHLEGTWSAVACLYNPFNEEFEVAAAVGPSKDSLVSAVQTKPDSTIQSQWLDDRAYRLVFPGKDRPQGYMIFSAQGTLELEERNSLTVAFATMSYLTSSVLENIRHQTENALMERLKSQKLGT